MILYHGTPYKNWELVQREGLKPAILPKFVAEISGTRTGVYVGVRAVVDGFVEGYLADVSGESKFVILSVDILDVEKLIPDPDMKDLDFPGYYIAYVYPGWIPPDRIILEKVVDLEEELGSTPYPLHKGVIPHLPEEARGDFLFFEYVRDMAKYEALSEEDVQRMWEGWESRRGR